MSVYGDKALADLEEMEEVRERMGIARLPTAACSCGCTSFQLLRWSVCDYGCTLVAELRCEACGKDPLEQ